ncbi:MAG: hypothetical protein U0893_16165 [Chloroflexota bacterium]
MLADPDYEVKMLVNPGETLNDDGKLKHKLREEFGIERSEKAVMQFVDGDGRELDRAGWFVRLRAFEGDDGLQVTYKKRYDVDGDDVAGAFERARADGFADAPEAYESQVEWGRDKMTLTVSLKASGGPRDPDSLDQPGDEQSREIALSGLPSVLEQDQQLAPEGARGILERARRYGPVFGERWIGEWRDDELFVEVWQVRSEDGAGEESLVEVSFKKKKHDAAERRRDDLRELLEKQGWLAARQTNKTPLILSRY